MKSIEIGTNAKLSVAELRQLVENGGIAKAADFDTINYPVAHGACTTHDVVPTHTQTKFHFIGKSMQKSPFLERCVF